MTRAGPEGDQDQEACWIAATVQAKTKPGMSVRGAGAHTRACELIVLDTYRRLPHHELIDGHRDWLRRRPRTPRNIYRPVAFPLSIRSDDTFPAR
ncbi:MAG: hypothetical protein ACLP50_01330 [Solirubrobacteraceae bacterium]